MRPSSSTGGAAVLDLAGERDVDRRDRRAVRVRLRRRRRREEGFAGVGGEGRAREEGVEVLLQRQGGGAGSPVVEAVLAGLPPLPRRAETASGVAPVGRRPG